MSAEQKVRHYTNTADEFIDMWHWKSVRTEPNGQFDDQYQSYIEGGGNGRHSDYKISGGYTNNKQTLTITGTSEEVDANGILTYDGSTIDPNTNIDFQRAGAAVGKFGIPSIYTQTLTGSRGDISSAATYTGTGWIVEFKRKLTVDSPAGQNGDKQDVDFRSLADQVFGLGVFDNAAIAHAIQPGLLYSGLNNRALSEVDRENRWSFSRSPVSEPSVGNVLYFSITQVLINLRNERYVSNPY